MDTELTEEQRMVRDMARHFAQTEVKPRASVLDQEEKFPWMLVPGLAKLGFLGMQTAPEFGGCGFGALTSALVLEEISRHDGSLGLTLASHNGLCSGHIRIAGTDAQKRRWLPDLASGKKLGAWGLTEPGSGSDAAGLRTTAVKKGDRWILNGSKIFITQGTVGEVFVVLASTDAKKKTHGISAFVLDKSMRGFTQKKMHKKLGMRSSDTAELFFEDVEVPDENLLGEKDAGFLDTLKVLDRGRISIGALGVGIARGALEESRDYAKTRVQFEKPIADFQAIQWMLADMAMRTDASRLVVANAAYLCDAGRSFSKEASMGKLLSSEAAVENATKAIQIHGGYGYSSEFPVERYWRDGKLLEIGEGTSEVQRLVIGRHILRA